MLNCTVHGAIAAISAATHGRNHQSSFLSTSCVILCLRSRYLSFVGNQKSRSGMYSLHPTRQCYHSKNRESHTDLPSQSARDFCHNILQVPSPAYYYQPTSANYLIRISAMSFGQTKHPYGDVKAVIDRERNITEKTYRKM